MKASVELRRRSAPGRANRTFVRDGRVEQEPVLRHHHHPAAQRGEPHPRSAATPESSTSPRSGPSAGSAAWRRWSCRSRSRRPPRPGSGPRWPGRRRRSTSGPPRVGEADARAKPHVDRPGRQVRRRRRPGRPRPARVSSTSSTRRQPATAFCASLSTSVAICTGWTNSATRNRNAVSWPTREPPPTPSSTPTTTTAASASPAASSPSENADHAGRQGAGAGPAGCPRWRASSRCRGAAGHAVRPDHLAPRRRSRRPRRAARRPARGPRRRPRPAGAGTSARTSTSGSERGETTQGQLPGVDQPSRPW